MLHGKTQDDEEKERKNTILEKLHLRGRKDLTLVFNKSDDTLLDDIIEKRTLKLVRKKN